MHYCITGQLGSGASALAIHLSRLEGEDTYTDVSFQDVSEAEVPLPECDGVILTVNLLEGPMPGTREALRRAMVGEIPIVGIALTHQDLFLAQTKIRQSIRELCLWETRELLSLYGYTDKEIPAQEMALVTGCEPKLEPFAQAVGEYTRSLAAE